MSLTLFTTHLNVDITEVIKGEGFALVGAETRLAFVTYLVEAFTEILGSLGLTFVMQFSKEAVVFLVSVKLKRVLVQSEESVVAVSKISKGAALKIIS